MLVNGNSDQVSHNPLKVQVSAVKFYLAVKIRYKNLSIGSSVCVLKCFCEITWLYLYPLARNWLFAILGNFHFTLEILPNPKESYMQIVLRSFWTWDLVSN
ncbi:hypothetical protein CDAR_603581 [Caerostris darwini]|uniref:Uncharacterized protein n=1 Tax=Caerostris darwini TaxID=1538125 RepID=A0AAV4T888_9ARAC|nr:hypothetical protein CDAR_603581 [Caerostris darwini]